MDKPLKQLASGIWVYPGSQINKTVTMRPGVIIGLPPDPDDDCIEYQDLNTVIGSNCYLNPYAIIYRGAVLHENVFIDCYCRIGCNTEIGKNTRIIYGTRIHNDVRIGKDCIIAGNVPNDTKIGNFVRHMGRLHHKYNNPHANWAETVEPSPIIEDYVVIGANAMVIGGITIGRNSYIAATEIVRESIPEKCVVYKGKIIPHNKWKGALKDLGFFEK